MTLREKIDQDFKDSFKNKNNIPLSTLRLFLTAIKNKEVEKRTRLSRSEPVEKLGDLSKLTDEEIIQVVSSEIKRRKEAAEQFRKGNRAELAEKEEAEIKILMPYMPAQMEEGQIRELVGEAIKKSGVTSPQEIGKVMAILMPQVKGKADGGMVNKIVREELEK